MTRVGTEYNLIIAKRYLSDLNEAYTQSLEPLSTGRRINRPSDDPARLSAYFQNVHELTQIEQYELNVSTARARLNITDATLGEVTEILNEAYVLAIEGNDQTTSDDGLEIVTGRLTALKEELTELVNTRIGSQYIFAGYQSGTEPFTGDPVVYNGDSNAVLVKVADGRQVQVNIDADEAFMGGGTGVDIFDTIDDLITSIEARDEVAVGALITDVQSAQDQISAARAQVGNSVKSLDTAEIFLQNRKTQVSERIADIADVDIAEATTTLSFNEYTLRSALEVTKRVLALRLQNFFA